MVFFFRDPLDRVICMEILRGYGLGNNLKRLLHWYWEGLVVVPKAGKFVGQPCGMEIGVTQGNPVSPTIFNIVVDAVVRVFQLEVCDPQESHHGLGWASG